PLEHALDAPDVLIDDATGKATFDHCLTSGFQTQRAEFVDFGRSINRNDLSHRFSDRIELARVLTILPIVGAAEFPVLQEEFIDRERFAACWRSRRQTQLPLRNDLVVRGDALWR